MTPSARAATISRASPYRSRGRRKSRRRDTAATIGSGRSSGSRPSAKRCPRSRFKRLRRHIFALGREPEDGPLPIGVAVLLYIHAYAVLGNGKGTLYEIIAARALGVTRAQTSVETLRARGAAGRPSLRQRRGRVRRRLPRRVAGGRGHGRGLARGLGARYRSRLRSGIDLGSDALEPGELELIRGWYERTAGRVPAHVELLADTAPAALKTQRARFETAVRGALPAQLVPLLAVHLSAIRLWPTPLRRSLLLARSLGRAPRRGDLHSALGGDLRRRGRDGDGDRCRGRRPRELGDAAPSPAPTTCAS